MHNKIFYFNNYFKAVIQTKKAKTIIATPYGNANIIFTTGHIKARIIIKPIKTCIHLFLVLKIKLDQSNDFNFLDYVSI